MRSSVGTSKVSEADLDLLRQVRAGDAQALDCLVERFEPLILWAMHRAMIPPVVLPREEVLQEFRIRLVQCARAWDPSRTGAFTTYLLHALANCARLCRMRGRPLGFRTSEDAVPETLSLDFIVPGAEGDPAETMHAFVVDRDSDLPYVRIDLRAWLESVLGHEPRLLQVVLLHYGFLDGHCHTCEAIGARFGLSRQGGHLLVKRAMRQLRKRVWEVDLSDVFSREGVGR